VFHVPAERVVDELTKLSGSTIAVSVGSSDGFAVGSGVGEVAEQPDMRIIAPKVTKKIRIVCILFTASILNLHFPFDNNLNLSRCYYPLG